MNLGQWVGLVVLLVAAYILWEIRQVLLLVFAAVVLAVALNRLALWLQRKFHIHRTWAVVSSVGLLLLVLVGILWLIVPSFAHQFQELTYLLPQGIKTLNLRVGTMRSNLPAWLLPYLPDVDSLIQQLQPLANQLLGRSVTFFSSSLGVVLNLLLVIVLTLMFLAKPQPYRQGFMRLFPSFYRRRIDQVLHQSEEDLGRWVVGALISMGVIALLSWIGLSFLQVRAALANAVLAGLLNLIPNIGPAFSVVPPMAIGLLDTPWKPLLVLGLYFGIQQFESTLLTPYIMAQQVSLLPAVTLIAQVFFASFFGFLGLLLALPLTVVGQVWVREVLIHDMLDQWKTPDRSGAEPEVVLAYDTLVDEPELESNRAEVTPASPEPAEKSEKTAPRE